MGKKRVGDWSDLLRMTQLVKERKRHPPPGFLTQVFLFYWSCYTLPRIYPLGYSYFCLCHEGNWDPLTKADLYFQCLRKPTNRLSSSIISFGFCSIEGLIFGNQRNIKVREALLIYHPRNHLFCGLSISNSGSEAQAWYTVLRVAQLLCILNSLFIEQVKLITQKCCFRQSNGHTIKLFIS